MSKRAWMYVKGIRRVRGICIKWEFWSVIRVYESGMERSEEESNNFREE